MKCITTLQEMKKEEVIEVIKLEEKIFKKIRKQKIFLKKNDPSIKSTIKS